MKRTLKISMAVLAAAMLMFATACHKLSEDNQSGSLLIIESIMGHTDSGTTALFLQSDVQDIDSTTKATYVTTDTASVTLNAALKAVDSVTGASQYNNITLTGYKVSYLLPDGTGDPGVTVPATIEESLASVLITVGQSTTLTIPVVLDSAKLAAPLAALVGTTNTLQVNATIEFYGKDLAGHTVSATGNLPIFFADYLDSTSSSSAGRTIKVKK